MVTTNSAMLPLGTTAPDFSLIDTVTGKKVSVTDATGQPLLVAFICNHCPYVKFIQPELARLTSRWLDLGVAVVGISSNDAQAHPDDGPQAMTREAATAGYRFPYLFDGDQAIAIAYRAACTPDFFLFDRLHRLVYRGQFCPARRKGVPLEVPTGSDLAAAVAAVLHGAPPLAVQRPSIGCNIKWSPGREPAYFQELIIR